MYFLYGGDFTRSVLVQWVLEEGGLAYELRKLDIFKGEHKAGDFLAINPAGLVPVLVTPEGQALHEAAALMVYLADRHGLTDLAPSPTDPARGLFLSTIFHLAGDIQAEMKRFHYPHRFSPRSADNLVVQDMARSLVLARLAVIDARLAGAVADGDEPDVSLARLLLAAHHSYERVPRVRGPQHRDSHGTSSVRNSRTAGDVRAVSTRAPMTLERPAAARLHTRRMGLVNRDRRQCRDRLPEPVVPPFAAHGTASLGMGIAPPFRSSSRSESSDLARRSR